MIFNREDRSYELQDGLIDKIICDPASPIAYIAQLIPDGFHILDVGAGNGVLARVLQRLGKQVVIDGIEPNKFAAAIAGPFYRKFWSGYLSDLTEAVDLQMYDMIVLADVLEHVEDPLTFLLTIRTRMKETAIIVISVPNVAFGAVRLALLNGHFEYVNSGILEKTHLRFFTKESILRLFEESRLFPESVRALNRSFYRTEIDRDRMSSAIGNVIRLAFDDSGRAYQYVFRVGARHDTTLRSDSVGASPGDILLDYIIGRVRATLKKSPFLRGLKKRLSERLQDKGAKTGATVTDWNAKSADEKRSPKTGDEG